MFAQEIFGAVGRCQACPELAKIRIGEYRFRELSDSRDSADYRIIRSIAIKGLAIPQIPITIKIPNYILKYSFRTRFLASYAQRLRLSYLI